MSPRQLTTALTLSALVVVLCAMAAWGLHEATRPLPPIESAKEQACTGDEISKQTFVHRDDITVSVFNAGARKGFASLTLERLEALGFNPGSVGNAPSGDDVARAKVFTTEQDDAAAELVARTLGRHVPVEVVDEDLGPGIDVYVGRKQRGLSAHPPTKLKLAKPVTTCVQVD